MTIWDIDRHAFLQRFVDIGRYQKMNIFEKICPNDRIPTFQKPGKNQLFCELNCHFGEKVCPYLVKGLAHTPFDASHSGGVR